MPSTPQPGGLTRREWAAAVSAPAVLRAASPEPDLIRRHDAEVDRLLKLQITDPAHPQRGGYADEFGMYSAGAASGLLDGFLAAYACPGSRHHSSRELAGRILLAAAYLEGKQHEDGTIDLLITNFHSTPDLGFVVHGVAAAAWLARAAGEAGLLRAMTPFLEKAGRALSTGGVHTPNHRWVVCEALAQIHELLPNAAYVKRVDQWMAEGIDMDDDGQFSERSTTVYNPITCKALSVVALKLGRPELLDYVRRNLDSMLWLQHPGGEVVTEISTRQDQYERGSMDRYWFPLRLLAVRDGNGRYATLVRSVEGRAASLSAILRYPELAAALPAPAPIDEDFVHAMPSLDLVRFRRGDVSASLLANGSSRFFTLHHGACVVEAVRFASAFFGKGQFRPTAMESASGGYLLRQSLEAPYYQPLDPPRRVTARDYGASRGQRRQSEVQRLDYLVTVAEQKGGFRLAINAAGTPGVPLAVEVALRAGVEVDGVVPAPRIENASLLKQGYVTARAGGRSIRFGPGFGEHAYTQVRGADPKLAGQSVYLCGFTPLERTITFECS